MPLREAAAELGISKDAVRQRIRRETLQSDKGEDGRVYVYLDASVDAVHADAPEEHGRGHDVVDELRDRIAYLERQVEEERDARRRADTLLARLMDRVPELEPPSEAPGASETAEEQQGRDEPHPDRTGAQEGARSPWWRRVFRT